MIQLLKPADIRDLTMEDGAVIRLRRYGLHDGNANGLRCGARLVLSHGNGLAINAYAPFWLPLTRDFDVVVFDIRNHGENPLHPARNHSWPAIFADFEQVFQGIQRSFGEAPAVGVFHSLSAIAALEHELAHGPRWAGLALFDPPILPREGHPLLEDELSESAVLSQRTRRRPTHYDRVEEFAAQLRRKSAFSRWLPEAPMLVAQHTLRASEDGRWELCNPRELEAHLYESKPALRSLWTRMSQLRTPTILIGGDPEAPFSSTSARTCRAIHEEVGADYTFIPDTTHFLQIEEPQACREALLAFMRASSLV